MKQFCYIARHQKYIDHRLEVLRRYCDSSIQDGPKNAESLGISIPGIMQVLTGGSQLKTCPHNEVLDALHELKELIDRWDILTDGDIVGYIYQELQPHTSRKKHGRYYTPRDIVEYLVEKAFNSARDIREAHILDPACGSGLFLMAAHKKLAEIGGEIREDRTNVSSGLLHGDLFGFDRDATAVEITRYNLMRISGSREKTNIHRINYINKNIKNETYLPPHGFDIIIGNPPWGSPLSAEEKEYAKRNFRSSRSGINTFTLFIEQSLELLAENGILAFLLPEAYLNIRAHTASRLMLLENTRILDIALWGERFKGVFAPAVSCIVKKTRSPKSRAGNVVRIHNHSRENDATALLIPQSYYAHTPHSIFNINYSRRAVSIMTRIEEQDCFYLRDRARFFLGIVTGDNERLLGTQKTKHTPDPIIIGKDISQFRIRFSGHHFKYDSSALQQVAPRECYLARNKLLYKFIGRRLVFALDELGMYSLNNVNGLIPDRSELCPESLMSLLNSSLMQYYYENSFFTIKVLRGNLERLPLKRLSSSSQGKIRDLARQIMESDGDEPSRSIKRLIDDIVFFEYGIKDGAASRIYEPHAAEACALRKAVETR